MKRLFLQLLVLTATVVANAQNPYLPLWEHLPDGEPRVFEDPDQPGKYRAYIIGSHDVTYTAYCGPDIRMWSAPVEDLSQWRDEGPIFTWFVNGQWDTMFAPDLVETVDKATGKKTYWLYPHSRGWQRVPMVCKGDRPDGPFTPVNLTADGTKCLPGSLIDFDPSVFIETITNKKDKDFDKGYRAYVFYGFQHSTACELDQNTMYSKREGTELIDPFIPASSHDGKLLDKAGSEYKALYKGQNPLDFNFFEASSIRQIGNKYVMVFSGYSGKEYGLGNTNSALRYAFGDSPLGPWRSGGVLVDSRGVVVGEDGGKLITTNAGHNTHGSLQEINGQWYVFYHRPPRGFGNARQAMVAPVKITWDKKPVAKGGIFCLISSPFFTVTSPGLFLCFPFSCIGSTLLTGHCFFIEFGDTLSQSLVFIVRFSSQGYLLFDIEVHLLTNIFDFLLVQIRDTEQLVLKGGYNLFSLGIAFLLPFLTVKHGNGCLDFSVKSRQCHVDKVFNGQRFLRALE